MVAWPPHRTLLEVAAGRWSHMETSALPQGRIGGFVLLRDNPPADESFWEKVNVQRGSHHACSFLAGSH